MLSRVSSRTYLAFKRNLGAIALGAVCLVLAFGYLFYAYHPQQQTDCADVVITNLDGPATHEQDQATWDCLTPQLQQAVGDESNLEKANSQFPRGIQHTRIGQSNKHSDGSIYVFYDTSLGTTHHYYVITLDGNGKVLSIG